MRFMIYESLYQKEREGVSTLVSVQDVAEVHTKLDTPGELLEVLERVAPRVKDYKSVSPIEPEMTEPFRIFSCEYETQKRRIVYHFIQKVPASRGYIFGKVDDS